MLFSAEDGIDLPPERRRLGYVFQEGRLFPHYSVRGNLNYGRAAGRRGAAIGFDAVVALLGFEELLDRRPGDLSGGEKQRVAIGRALLASRASCSWTSPSPRSTRRARARSCRSSSGCATS